MGAIDGANDSEPWTLTIPEAAKMLGISRASAYQAAARGEIPTVRFGRRILVARAALDEMLRFAERPRNPDEHGSPRPASSQGIPSRFHLIRPGVTERRSGPSSTDP